MITENTFDKLKLISELKEIHIELVEVYKKIFDYKYRTNADFEAFIDKEYKENKISDGEQQVWNDNFCHRASYTLLNKILFIRICEDKGFMLNPEDYVAGEPKDPHIGKKLSRIGLQKWANLVTNYTLGELVKLAFLDMKKSYGNIALYKDDKYEMLTPTTEELSLKYLDGDEEAQKLVLQFENALSNIVEKLDTNNYNFNNTDGNILGDVYEKFMDRVTRKAIGQFYTPEFVIEYILNNTVAKADVVENPFLSIADISCGSGHFLIMAYDILKEKFINNIELLRDKYSNEVYKIKKNGREEELTGREYWKEENIHYHLLKHCIYGADIDSFAIQLTTINLLLKDLDNFTDELNIVECDSLIKWEEDYDWKDLKQQLEEEFETVEYNQINLLGEEEKTLVTKKKETYELTYKDIIGLEKTEKISKERAEEIVCLCEFWSREYEYVVGNPPYFIVNDDIKKGYYLKKYKSAKFKIDVYSLFIERGLFKTKKEGFNSFITPNSYLDNYYSRNLRDIMLDYTIHNLAILSNGVFEDAVVHPVIYVIKKSRYSSNEIGVVNNFGNIDEEIFHIDQGNFLNNNNHEFIVLLKGQTELIIDKMKKDSVPLNKLVNITQTIKTGDDKKYLYNYKLRENFKPVLRGKDIQRYQSKFQNVYLDYGDWLRIPRNPKFFEQEKLLIREAGKRVTATYDNDHYYTMSSLYVVNKLDTSIDLMFILGILNSALIQFFMKNVVYDKTKGAFTKARIFHLDQIPVKNVVSRKEKNQLISFVQDILDANKSLANLEIKLNDKSTQEIYNTYKDYYELKYHLKSKIEELDKKIDKLVYEIYDMDEEEIKLIEDSIDDSNDGSNILKVDKINYDIFIDKYFNEEKTLEDIHGEYSITYKQLFDWLMISVKELHKDRREIYYNLNELCLIIYDYLRMESAEIMETIGNYNNISNIKEQVNDKLSNFDSLITIVRQNDSTKNSVKILKDSIEIDSCTWNAYRKAKKNNKVNKTFIKYFDNNYYGLAEWSDEIHKNYFLDAIEEYTVNSPNEKKAKDILKLFKDLDIEDRQDYIEVIEEKIRKTFK